MEETVLTTLIGILIVGIGAQWIAWRLRIPSILILLLSGFILGPFTGLLHPDHLFGELLFPWVSISVAIILFEGGLSLRISELEKIGSVVRNLVSIGILITWGLATLGAWWILDMKFSLAMLLGAILVVTGPTVIMPMLRSLRLSDRMSSILKWEAMLNDPVGAILAVLVFEAILATGLEAATSQALVGLFNTIVIGIGLGVIAAWIMKEMLRRYWIPDFLQNAFTLMMVVAVFGLSNMLQAESGLVAVTIVGILLANQKEIMVKHIVEFKENLRVLLIASLFIVLGARLDLDVLMNPKWEHFAFVGFLFFVVRPLMVFVSTIGSDLNWKEKVFLSWLCPRGIVAAAVSSIFAIHLEHAGYPEASELLSVTFIVIMSTVLVYGLSSPWLAKILKLAQPNPQGVLIAGGHDWGRRIALILKENGFRVLIIDTNNVNVRAARRQNIPAIRRDILAENVIDEIELNGIGRFISLTPNDEVNSLGAILFSEVFGRAEVYQLPLAEKEKDTAKIDVKRSHGRLLFGERSNYAFLEEAFESGAKIRTVTLTEEYDYEAFKMEYQDEGLVLFSMGEPGKDLKIPTVDQPLTPKAGQSLVVLVYEPSNEGVS